MQSDALENTNVLNTRHSGFLSTSEWVMEFPFCVQGKVYLILRVGYFLMPFHSEV